MGFCRSTALMLSDIAKGAVIALILSASMTVKASEITPVDPAVPAPRDAESQGVAPSEPTLADPVPAPATPAQTPPPASRAAPVVSAPDPVPVPVPEQQAAPADPARPAKPAPANALAFVQERHLGESLGWLGYQVASRTVTFSAVVDAVGRTKAQELVQDELQSLQPQYQQEWDRNLAAAYAASFTVDELAALDVADPAPDVANKFRNKQRDVGLDMKERSSELLKVYVSTALDNALKKAKP